MSFTKAFFFIFITSFLMVNTSIEASIDKYFSSFKSLKSLKADFKQDKLIKSLDIVVSSEGRLEIDKPEFFLWAVVKPSSISFKFEKNEIQLITNGKVTMSTQVGKVGSDLLEMINFLKSLMNMDKEYILSHFHIKETSEKSFLLTPVVEKKLFQQISIKFGSRDEITKIILTELSGDLITINFLNHIIKYAK